MFNTSSNNIFNNSSSFDLSHLGWNGFFQSQYESNTEFSGFLPARVAVENKERYTVLSAEGELAAEVSGRMLFSAESPSDFPKVGDWVLLNVFPDEQKGIIQHVLDRQTRFSRKSSGAKFDEQIIAANIDVLFIVQSLDNNFNLRRLERYLVMANEGGIQPFVILSKSDLCSSAEEKAAQITLSYPNLPVVHLSSLNGEGIDRLSGMIRPGLTYAFVGSSGTGKSTLINRLLGGDILATGEVREKDSRGRHTTTRRELLVFPSGGLLIDTPGMREFHLWTTDGSIDEVFGEIDSYARECRFKDCRHISEKGCAVLEAVESGEISSERYNSYLKLLKEEEFLAVKTDKNEMLKRKQKDKILCREIKRVVKNSNKR